MGLDHHITNRLNHVAELLHVTNNSILEKYQLPPLTEKDIYEGQSKDKILTKL